MKISVVLRDALIYPFSNIKRLFILFILLLGTFLLIPVIFAYGYIIKVIKTTINGSDVLPDFSDSNVLIEDGFKYFFASIIFGIPTYIVYGVLLFQYKTNFITFNILNNPGYLIILTIITFLVGIVFFIGLANLAYQNRFKAVFEFKNIFKLINAIGWKKYLVILVIFTLVTQLVVIITSLLYNHSTLTPLNSFIRLLESLVIFALINSYILTFGSRLRGLIYPVDIVKPVFKDKTVSGVSNANIKMKLKAKNSLNCINCGTENPENAQFCQECGSKLKNSKPPKKSKKEAMIVIGVVGLAVILVILGLFGYLFTSNNLSNGYVVYNNSTPMQQYNGYNISFNYPQTWNLRVINSNNSTTGPIINVYQSAGPMNPTEFQVQLQPNYGLSEQAALNLNANNQMDGGVKISNDTLIIDGITAYEDIYLVNNGQLNDVTFNQIYFVKNDTTYLITLQAPQSNYNNVKPVFNMFLNSFNITN